MDQPEAARAELERALSLDTRLAGAHYMLGVIHSQSADFAAAAAELQAAVALS
jgi:Tfp pilus assembly protein PilF